METAILLAFFLLLIYLKKEKRPFYHTPGIIPLSLLLLYIAVQVVPIPAELMKYISPSTYSVHNETIGAIEKVNWISISINKKATLMEFFRILSYAIFYILTVQVLSNKEYLKKTISAVIILASILSVYSIFQYFLTSDRIYWFRYVPVNSIIFGPYVCHNHYAGFMAMIFPLAFSLFFYYKPRVTYKSFKEIITEIFDQKRTNTYFFLFFASILIITSIFLSLSRGAIISISLSTLFLITAIIRKRFRQVSSLSIIIVILLLVLSIGWFGWDNIIERFEELQNREGKIYDLRFNFWEDSMGIIKDFPLTGTGFMTFVNIFPKYRTFSGEITIFHAHNDYIELFTDGGIIAAVLTGLFLFIVLYKSYKVYRKRRESYSALLFLGGIAGVLSIIFHSFTDFNLRIGANGLYFFFLLGVVVSSANTRLRHGLEDTYLQKRNSSPSLLLIIVAGIVLATLAGINVRSLLGNIYFSKIKDIYLDSSTTEEELLSIKKIAYRSSRFDPLESQYHYGIANTEAMLNNYPTAASHYKESIRLNPLKSEYLQRHAFFMSLFKEYDTAERLFQAGIKYDKSNPERYIRYALWLLTMDRKEEGISTMRQAISLETGNLGPYLTVMILNGLSEKEMLSTMPERVEPYLYFADYLVNVNQQEMAEDVYLKAFQLIEKEEIVRPWYFDTIYWYYMERGLYDEALMVIQKATELLPEDAYIRILSGNLYERFGLTYRAIEEYKKALTIEPENQEAKKSLDRLLTRKKMF